MLVDGLSSIPGTDISSGLPGSKLVVCSGDLSVQNKFSRWHPHTNVTLDKLIVSVGAAATGADLQVNVNKNGSPITASPITITAGSTETTVDSGSLLDTAATTADYYTFDIVQIGSTIAGRDLCIQFNFTVD